MALHTINYIPTITGITTIPYKNRLNVVIVAHQNIKYLYYKKFKFRSINPLAKWRLSKIYKNIRMRNRAHVPKF